MSAKKVPPERYSFLDNTVNSIFRYDRYMRDFIRKTYNCHLARIGVLVQLEEEEIFKKIPTSKRNRKRLKQALARNGLEFGMVAPGWRSPDEVTVRKR